MGRNLSVSLCFLSAFLFLTGCGVPSGTDNSSGRQAIVDQVNHSLSTLDCSTALQTVLPAYNSANSDNSIRLSTAASYGCYAKINVLNNLYDLESFSGNLAGSGFFEFLVQEFPSTASPDDKVPTSAEDGMDAVMAAIQPGTVLVSSDLVSTDSNNVISLLYSDRTDDANSYLTFLGMSLVGSLLDRYGAPTSNYHKSQTLPWTTPTAVTSDGCAVAAGLLNFSDGLEAITAASPTSVAALYSKIGSTLTTGLNTACSAGCSACASLPGSTVSCTTCPLSLRNRSSCTGLDTDTNSCAAAGIVTFVNTTWSGPP